MINWNSELQMKWFFDRKKCKKNSVLQFYVNAEYFFQGSCGSHYMYLETIQEETSDDLQSDSDVSEARTSPVGWLATDSEAGSVICVDKDSADCESDREAACPAKRRKQDNNYLTINLDDDCQSISRSSSLLQFETLEKQCQETCNSSPSVYSQFSFDSLDVQPRSNLSPDSLDRVQSDCEQECDYYKALKIDVPRKKENKSFYNATQRFGGSDSSDSDGTLGGSRSYDNLRNWRSFDSLPTLTVSPPKTKDEVSVENLSEDSGYSDKSPTDMKTSFGKTQHVDFDAYDGEGFQSFSGNFGTSYQDLSVFDKYDVLESHTSPLIERFMRRRGVREATVTKNVKLEKSPECGLASNFNAASASEPNLPASVESSQSVEKLHQKEAFLDGRTCACSSVPKDLNLARWRFDDRVETSVAAKNFDIADLNVETSESVKNSSCNSSNLSELLSLDPAEMSSFRREGSYAEAMANRVDLSDDENSLIVKKPILKRPRNTMEEFERKVLKAISEQSVQSVGKSVSDLVSEPKVFPSSPVANSIGRQNRCFTSTPNVSALTRQTLSNFEQDERRRSCYDVRRKNSLINGSTSTSGVSDFDDKTITSAKSLGETSSKGVHFNPLVDEVNWNDDSESSGTAERESSYSLRSSPERELTPVERKNSRSPEPGRMSYSQPDLHLRDEKLDFIQSLRCFQGDLAKSQPEISHHKLKRRGSQLMKKDNDGCLIKAYIDGDGIQYKHTHLDLDNVYGNKPPTTGTASSHVHGTSNNTESVRSKSVVVGMAEKAGDRKGGKFGGFFSRLASFRFSARKDAKKKTNGDAAAKDVLTFAPQMRQATKEDYIYIPLKGPTSGEAKSGKNGRVSGKPPVPRAPPRVVGASVKRAAAATVGTQGGGGVESHERRRRKTIDSGSRPMEPMGLIETDLDTQVTVVTDGADVKTRSLLNLGAAVQPRLQLSVAAPKEAHRPHKSMEFLLDKENIKVVEPPENELQKGERVMSEHQLRVQRSLQKLTIPDWYKQSQIPQEGFLLKKHQNRETRWTGTGSRTTSLSSLGSVNQSPIILSPTPQSQPFVRWSTSKLNSTASSPCASTRSSFNTRQANGSLSPSSVRSSFSYRQPYLGWRSQERLTKPRTPAERLANTLLPQNNHHQQLNPDIQSSIKEVTSAIVHYVSGLKPEENRPSSYDSQDTASQRSSSVSPRGSQKLCWLESSFVGTKPLDSPQTPVTLSESSNPGHHSSLRLELHNHNDISLRATNATKPSPGSTTLEDVLDSLLGLPSSTRAPSPSLQETVSANTSPNHKKSDQLDQFRRRSEGSEPTSYANTRRVSLNCSPVLKCRFSRCGKIALAASLEGTAFKNCHNCSYTYCSRQCRRAHWEKHRKTCLFSRIGTLCRQVIASIREQKDTLLHLSEMARRGHISHGAGAVKCFFHNPESAEQFLTTGLQYLGELTYIPWHDLLPNEMGPQMYAELVKMCKNYNPDTKLVLYISICVISETPMTGAVKWERQLVSRCAKMRLSKDIQITEKVPDHPETLILTCPPLKGNEIRIREMKEICISNLVTHLRQRGVSLRRQHQDIYKQLQSWMEENCTKFTPVTVYPKDVNTGRSFMCIIMLEADEESVRQIELAGVKVKTVDVLKE
ncbi:uncharacterized protein LOC123677004 isoform X2 [Harmonia axyridis]|uniref:uncharacterized protein LOC123677004 isoform X2 n=1 Tax=Harmonia axyridis TaxID=115357 RepID=UPI001E276EC1|nr:uncharacterized protein LOC123677004 isoform X2 [Harmonia axyridis]